MAWVGGVDLFQLYVNIVTRYVPHTRKRGWGPHLDPAEIDPRDAGDQSLNHSLHELLWATHRAGLADRSPPKEKRIFEGTLTSEASTSRGTRVGSAN